MCGLLTPHTYVSLGALYCANSWVTPLLRRGFSKARVSPTLVSPSLMLEWWYKISCSDHLFPPTSVGFGLLRLPKRAELISHDSHEGSSLCSQSRLLVRYAHHAGSYFFDITDAICHVWWVFLSCSHIAVSSHARFNDLAVYGP